ncbi:MAG: 4'-phosphopantetheinyl transferase superfamily protein [Kiritimatiellae bacterium]|nr:4'-phosphopantetheinyl transferase superfamily protein [Kiritimatiellia bacterium]
MSELVLVSAANEEALLSELDRLILFLERIPDARFLDVAYTASLSRGPSRLAVIADDVPSLRARLASARDRISSGSVKRIRDKSGTYYSRERLVGDGRGKLAFVYPGVFSFYPDMLRDLAVQYPECRVAFDVLEEAFSGNEEFVPSSFIFPPAPYYRHDADIFSSGAYAQALVSTYAGCDSLTRYLDLVGVSPDGVVGFAGGDLAAIMRAGYAGENPSRTERVEMVRDIYSIVYKAVNHGGLPEVAMFTLLHRHPGEVEALVSSFPPGKVDLVVDFSPRRKTYAVAKDFEEEALAAFAAADIRYVRLDLDRPFNTPKCPSLILVVRKFADRRMRHSASIDVYSCATASLAPSRLRRAREDTAERWAKPVLFAETIRKMHADGYRVFLEVGPRGLMSAAISDTLRGEEHAAIALDSIHRSTTLQIRHAMGQLATLGVELDISGLYERRGAKKVDFDSTISLEVRRTSEMRLSRAFPRLTLLTDGVALADSYAMTEPKGRGGKAARRAAVMAQQARRQRRFDFGALNPLISDADTLEASPGVSVSITKVFRLSEMPFLGDFALGTSQLSYSDPNLKGLMLLSLPLGAEIMAETAGLVVPNRTLKRIEDFTCRRMVSFRQGEMTLFMSAERVGSREHSEIAVKVQIRDDTRDATYTWPVMEAVVVLSDSPPPPRPASPSPLSRPRSVHWTGRDIYPSRLSCGKRLRCIDFVSAWSESGLDYEMTVPQLSGCVAFTRFPLWVVNPLLIQGVVSGFALWRSHERLAGAFSFPFRLRSLSFSDALPNEGASLNCYLRLTGVTPKSQLCDIIVTDGNGTEVLSIEGWEELTERIPMGYRELVLQPALTFLSTPLQSDILGSPSTDVASAFVTDVPYAIFERNEELWLRMISRIVLNASERKDFQLMTGSVSRRTEWLFGRIVAKEAVRRFLKDYCQARWAAADVQIWADDSGKPHALGDWSSFLTGKLDIAIAHTAQFIVAVAAANARVGVDVESVSRDLSEEFTAGVFTPDELELAANASSASQAVIKFWCAKEAVSKALGTGIRYSPKEMTVTKFLPDSGVLTIRLEGAWLDAFKSFRGRDIEVAVRTIRDHALATCFIPSVLFEE